MKTLLAVAASIVSLLTFVAGVMVFVFAYVACFRPGYDDDLTGASLITMFLAVLLGGLAAALWVGALD